MKNVASLFEAKGFDSVFSLLREHIEDDKLEAFSDWEDYLSKRCTVSNDFCETPTTHCSTDIGARWWNELDLDFWTDLLTDLFINFELWRQAGEGEKRRKELLGFDSVPGFPDR